MALRERPRRHSIVFFHSTVTRIRLSRGTGRDRVNRPIHRPTLRVRVRFRGGGGDIQRHKPYTRSPSQCSMTREWPMNPDLLVRLSLDTAVL